MVVKLRACANITVSLFLKYIVIFYNKNFVKTVAFSSFLEEIFKNKKPLPREKLNVIVNLTEKGIRA